MLKNVALINAARDFVTRIKNIIVNASNKCLQQFFLTDILALTDLAKFQRRIAVSIVARQAKDPGSNPG